MTKRAQRYRNARITYMYCSWREQNNITGKTTWSHHRIRGFCSIIIRIPNFWRQFNLADVLRIQSFTFIQREEQCKECISVEYLEIYILNSIESFTTPSNKSLSGGGEGNFENFQYLWTFYKVPTNSCNEISQEVLTTISKVFNIFWYLYFKDFLELKGNFSDNLGGREQRNSTSSEIWNFWNASRFTSVSYTHLTLPTIYSV